MLDLFRFFDNVYRLKRTPRAGFWYYGVKSPETVAEHVFGVAILTYIFGEYLRSELNYTINVEKALKMAIIHELGEAMIGDIHLESRNYIGKCVEDGERKALEEMAAYLPDNLQTEIKELYNEFEKGETIEATLVRSLDKVDLLIQALNYEKAGYRNLDKFFDEQQNFKYIEHISEIRDFVQELKKRRPT
ncbi:MAG TPA: HD domain-containing protein [Candidatus Hydrothermia bacterium]|nr:HD domain-containing protein [Candidatus Hydrothermia bacterium]MDD5572614.1 HD domain-containing protein [Candidatus Hydrothermia bacterium]HOK23143.1 HD domain-containing protein [Candidatus Hydrothermia bacterium]HOL23847.1 HD domain-containing protein [Candidatus Hydrothermia bacterium]HOP31895.1 HD domain-containing protein [Candidatus Hydrothermia bacterium]